VRSKKRNDRAYLFLLRYGSSGQFMSGRAARHEHMLQVTGSQPAGIFRL